MGLKTTFGITIICGTFCLFAISGAAQSQPSDIPVQIIHSAVFKAEQRGLQVSERLPRSSRRAAGRDRRFNAATRAAKSSAFPFVDIDLLDKNAPVQERRIPRDSPPAPAAFAHINKLSNRIPTRANASNARSPDKTQPWSSDRLLADATGMNDGYLDLAVNPLTDRLYAVFEATDLGGTDRDIHIAWSDDAGQSWQVREMPSFSQDESMPEIAIDAAGYIYVVWIREDGYIVRTRSATADDPENWAWVKGFFTDSINTTPAIAVSGSGDLATVFIAAAYQEINTTYNQWEWTLVWLYSTDGGSTIDFDYLLPDGYPDLWPDVAISGSIVHLINGEADIATGKPRILISSDVINGSFGQITDLTSWTSFSSGFPRVVSDGQTVVAVFQHDYEDGNGGIDGDIIQYVSWDNGTTFNGPHEVVADPFESVGPMVYTRDGVVGYLWLDAPPSVDEFDVAARQGGHNGDPAYFGEVEVVTDRNLAEPQFHYLAGVIGRDGLHAAWTDRRDFMSGGLNIYISDRAVLPNLAPFAPQGWSDVLIANTKIGLRENGYLEAMQTAYLSFAMLNNGLSPVIGETRIVLQINGIPRTEWILADGLPTATYMTIEDYPLLLSAGTHEIRMTIDYQATIAETDETDNITSRTWTWIAGGPVVRIEPPMILHQSGIVNAASAFDPAGLRDNPPLKLLKRLPTIDSRLQIELDSAAKSGRLPVIFSPTRRVDTARVAELLLGLGENDRRTLDLEILRRHNMREHDNLNPLLSDLSRRGQIDELHALWLPGMFSATMSPEAIEALAADPDIGWIWLDDQQSRTFGEPDTESGAPTTAFLQADKAALAWHLTHIGADRAWADGFDGTGILVGHLDSGVSYDHPDLATAMWDGGIAWPNHGYDAVDQDNDPYDEDIDWRHGTHTAGLIVGDGTSGTATGTAPGATLMALRVLPGYWSDLIAGMQFALDNGPVDLFSMSGGWTNPANDLKNANRLNADVLFDLDIPWIVATGNGDNIGGHLAPPQDISSPADCPNPWYGTAGHSSVIAVGAVGSANKVWSGSSIGPTVWDIAGTTFNDYPLPAGLLKPDIAAPGEAVSSTWSNNGYVSYSGTSMACPIAAGAVAILMQASPNATSALLAEALESTALDIGLPGRDVKSGAGVIDIPAALGNLPILAREVFWIYNDGPLPLDIDSLVWTQPWLSVVPVAGSIAPGDSLLFKASFATTGLGRGTYSDAITLVANDVDSPHIIEVVLAIDAPSLVGEPLPVIPAVNRIQAYPNPFNPQTEIRFETFTPGPTRLTIHDLRGRSVRTLLDAEIGAGDHILKWKADDDQGRSLAGGVYLLRLVEPGGRVTTGKISLIR